MRFALYLPDFSDKWNMARAHASTSSSRAGLVRLTLEGSSRPRFFTTRQILIASSLAQPRPSTSNSPVRRGLSAGLLLTNPRAKVSLVLAELLPSRLNQPERSPCAGTSLLWNNGTFLFGADRDVHQ